MDSFTWLYWVTMIMIILGAVMLIFIWGIFPLISQSELTEFCQEEGYFEAIYSPTAFGNSYCIEYKGNIKIKYEVEFCDGGWCFVQEVKHG